MKGGRAIRPCCRSGTRGRREGRKKAVVGRISDCSTVLTNVQLGWREPWSPRSCWNGPAFISHDAQSLSGSHTAEVQWIPRGSSWAISQLCSQQPEI